jgi:hypothetical protein
MLWIGPTNIVYQCMHILKHWPREMKFMNFDFGKIYSNMKLYFLIKLKSNWIEEYQINIFSRK